MKAPFGFCTDVMEHIPTEDVGLVVGNIMEACDEVFFQISTQPDVFGKMIGQSLHHTVQNHRWWSRRFKQMGFEIAWDWDGKIASCFHIKKRILQ